MITFYYHIDAYLRCVFVKEGAFFELQGGLTEEWGKGWTPIQADSIEHARSLVIKANPGTSR